MIAITFMSLYRILGRNLSNFDNYKKITIGLLLVFFTCGIHYLLQIIGSSLEVYWGWGVQVPFTFAVIYFFNPLTLRNSERRMNEFFEPVEALRRSDERLSLIQKGSKVIMIAELVNDGSSLIILWCSQGFIEWVESFLDTSPKNLIGLDWYELASIPFSWREQHREIVSTQIKTREFKKEWKERNKVVDWCVVPFGNKCYVSFGDLSDFYNEIERLANINASLINQKLRGL